MKKIRLNPAEWNFILVFGLAAVATWKPGYMIPILVMMFISSAVTVALVVRKMSTVDSADSDKNLK